MGRFLWIYIVIVFSLTHVEMAKLRERTSLVDSRGLLLPDKNELFRLWALSSTLVRTTVPKYTQTGNLDNGYVDRSY